MNANNAFIRNDDQQGHINIFLKPGKGMGSYFVRRVEDALAEDRRIFKIKFPNTSFSLFPNYCVPLAGAIDYYRTYRGCIFLPSRSTQEGTPAGRIGLMSPFTELPNIATGEFLNRIWKFNEENHYGLVSGIMSSIRRSIQFEQGVLNGIELCLNEVTDNILLHASRQDKNLEPGYVMAQVHKGTNRIAIAVYDNGVGIPSSLQSAGYSFNDPEEAIRLALQRGVTDKRGAGNGLWILDEIVRAGRGSLEIASDGVLYSFQHPNEADEGKTSFSLRNKLPIGGTTLVDFQLKASEPIDLESIIDGYSFTDLWSEDHEDLENERDLRLRVKEESPGLGSRYDAERFRILVENCLVGTEGKIILDFEGIDTVSLSFADELIRKFIGKYGLISFLQRIRLENISRGCAAAINAVTKQQ